jgi:O-antigen/teichoic acid export membrane protein
MVVCIVLLVTLSSVKLTAAHAVGINILCTLLTLLILMKILQSLLPQRANISSLRQETKEWISTSMSLVLVSALYLVNKQTDIIMIGFILGTAKSGIYSAASRLANFISFGLITVNAIAAPIIAELYSQKKHKELEDTVKLAVWFASCFAVFMGLIMMVWGKDILALYGIDFIQSYNCLIILMLGQIVNSLAGPVGLLMTMTSYQNEAALIIGCSAALNIVMNYFFIPLFGIQGAAIATVITAILWNLLLLARVAKHLRINPTIFPFTITKQI